MIRRARLWAAPIAAAVATLLPTGSIHAQEANADAHIVRVAHDPNRVFQVVGAMGWQTMIEFGADERIENVSIGDSTAWQVAPNKRANMLFIKPLTRTASSNMTVITSLRRYAFSLSVGPRRADTPWIINFDYPAPPVETLPEPPPPEPVRLNFAYRQGGETALLPSRVWDDGRQTYFEFAQDTALPAIFAGAPGDDESLVNVSMRGRIAVVQQIAQQFTLRSGRRFATVSKQTEIAQ